MLKSNYLFDKEKYLYRSRQLSPDPQTSLPTIREFEAWALKKTILRASGEGDQALLNQLLQAKTSIKDFTLTDEPVNGEMEDCDHLLILRQSLVHLYLYIISPSMYKSSTLAIIEHDPPSLTASCPVGDHDEHHP